MLACACTLGAGAATGSIEYTYADGNLDYFGKGKKEVIDVAMCIDDPGLSGMKLTGFKAYISGTEGVAQSSLWLSKELKIENKVNIPDIASYDVTPTVERVGTKNYGVLEVTLDSPYTLTSDPLYLGYTIEIDDVTSASAQTPVVYSKGVVNTNGAWIHMSKTILKWLQYNAELGGVAYIVAYLEADLPSNALGFTGQSPIYVTENDNYQGEFFVSNLGANPASSIKYVYSYDGTEVEYEGDAVFPAPLDPAIVTTYPVLLDFAGVSGLGRHDLQVTITEVNGMPNESLSPTINAQLNVIPFVPVHRPLVEEYTGLWCGWCPRGYIAMEMIAEDYGDNQVSICFHNGDEMTVTNNYPMNVGGMNGAGFPNASIDRVALIDPYEGSYPGSTLGIYRDIDAAAAIRAAASVEVEAERDGNSITARSHVRFIADMENTNYEVGFCLVGNGLFQPFWQQANYYAGRGGYQGTPLEQLTKWNDPEFGLVYNDVAIDVNGLLGVKGSIPATIKTNEDYVTEIQYEISANDLAKLAKELVVTTFLIDKSNGHIINANKCVVGSASTSVGSLDTESGVVSTEYFDLAGRKIANPDAGIYIRVDRLENGTSRSTKVVK